MLFKRKKPRSVVRKIREYVWPSMGWGRFFVYIKQRVLRLSDTPRNIALGLSFGVVASLNPFVGTHILQACLLALVFRANIPAAAIGTVAGNPLTFFFMWEAARLTGHSVVQDDLTARIVGAYLLALVLVLPCYYVFLSLLKAARLARSAFVNRKRGGK